MIISIASGKGGTGKTTVATNLALSINQKLQLFDCDVEEPNCYLFLNPIIEKKNPLSPRFQKLILKNAPFAKNAWTFAGMEPLRF